MCQRCKGDKAVLMSFAGEDGMDPGDIPAKLNGLTQVEGNIISLPDLPRSCVIVV